MSGEGSTNYMKLDNSSFLSISTDSAEKIWTPPIDLDSFLIRVYEYYQGKGFACSLLSRFFNLLSFTWVSFFILFILAFFDIFDFSFSVEFKIPTNPFFYLTFIILSILWMALFIYYLLSIRILLEMRSFYTNQLGIPEQEIPSINWDYIVDQLVSIPGLCRTAKLTHLHVAQRILRKENYMIALINKDILALYLPLRCFKRSRTITKSLEWSLSLTVFRVLFSNGTLKYDYEEVLHNHTLRKSISDSVRLRFYIVGIISLLLSPLIFLLVLCYFVLRYGEELRNKPNNLGFRTWSAYAHWKFREFNEFPHELEDRLNLAIKPATSYVEQFTSNKIILICKFVIFVCGSIVIVTLIGSFFNPNILDDNIFIGRNGLWWLAVCGSILAFCRAFIPDDDFVFQPEEYFDDVSKKTHYLPKHWQENCRSSQVLQEFNSLFQYRLYTLLVESLSVLYAPLILIFSLPHCSEEVVLFIYENTLKTKDVGDICTFSNFDFNKHGNTLYGSMVSAPEFKQSSDGKMEQSFINFSAKNPNWEPSELGKDMINNLSMFLGEHVDELPIDIAPTHTKTAHCLGNTYLPGENNITSNPMEKSILQLPIEKISKVQLGYKEKQEKEYKQEKPETDSIFDII